MKYHLLYAVAFISLSCVEKTTNRETEPTTTKETTELSEAEKIANNNGIANWDKVTQLDFTFNVDRGGKNVAKRSWSWKPKTGDVTMINNTDTITYNRSLIDSTSLRADQGFVNDKFWLLAPYQLAWDEGLTIETTEGVTSPLSRKQSKKLTTVYSNDGGYTPGDAYDYFYGDDYMITEWVYRRGNNPEPSMITTFEDYKNIEGLNIATMHRNEKDDFKLYFTDITVIK
ncbi:hypothetical protein [Dokdonia sp. Hel_I_53]|uniref:hypothetical protein n=1 Tax=Dokdonia sp. Hel_I_53 TaxID=1566287 RepID=UPI0011990187|nr:hypothetical protein [Dokdonia sp. Hel_I_53]TVZ51598.1 hypothetical protein OD90_0746 [Dokdonia sp. Hel_I_53]